MTGNPSSFILGKDITPVILSEILAAGGLKRHLQLIFLLVLEIIECLETR